MDFQNPKTILVVQIGKIGDMILTTPLFTELKKIFTSANLKVLSSAVNADIPLNHSSVDEVIIFHKNLAKNLSLLNRLRGKIDLWIDTKSEYSKTSELLVKLLKPKYSLGFNYDKNVFNASMQDHSKGKHATHINLSPINFFQKSLPRSEILPNYNIPLAYKDKFKDYLSGEIVINISAGNKSRYLENKVWVEIIERISKISSASILLLGLKEDFEVIKNIHETCGVPNEYYYPKNILEASEIIRKSKLVITPDTSIVHVCSAFNIPVIAMYPDVEWNLERFAPLSEKREVIISGDKNSLSSIDSSEVIEAFERIWKKINGGNAESRTRVRKEDH